MRALSEAAVAAMRHAAPAAPKTGAEELPNWPCYCTCWFEGGVNRDDVMGECFS